MSPTVRRAVPDDTDTVVDLVESAYRGEGSRVGWTTEADLLDGRRTGPDEVGAILDDADSTVLLLENSDATVLGCCVLRRADSTTAEFGMFAVRPGAQGGGLGSTLLAEAERIASDVLGASTVEMTVITHRVELIAYYERRGYHRTGEERPFPAQDERFGLPRRDDLAFAVLAKPMKLATGVSSEPRSS